MRKIQRKIITVSCLYSICDKNTLSLENFEQETNSKTQHLEDLTFK